MDTKLTYLHALSCICVFVPIGILNLSGLRDTGGAGRAGSVRADASAQRSQRGQIHQGISPRRAYWYQAHSRPLSRVPPFRVWTAPIRVVICKH